MRIAITGAAGLLGTALRRRFPEAVALSHRDLDITEPAAVKSLAADLIFNCAVIGVDDCERDPQLARRVNVDGPRLLAETGALLVHFSTNYVFDGAASEPYTTEDEARPVNVYGRTKLEGEREVLERGGIVVRTSWVFGPNKNSFLATAPAKLAHGEHIRAITDTYASTTYVEDLVDGVEELVSARRGGLHHVANDGVCTYELFALEAARLVGADERLIERISESEMKRDAPRPRFTPMRCDPPLRPWRDALGDYVRGQVRNSEF